MRTQRPDTVPVEVREAASMARTCEHTNKKQSATVCYFELFKKLGRKQGIEYSLRVLTALGAIDVSTKQCHLLAHGIGYGAFERDPSTWQKQVATLSHDGCREGVVHALVERGIGNLGGGVLSSTMVDDVCGKEPSMWCHHAIGHAMLIDKRADLKKALDGCFGLSGIFKQFLCNEGVFMEYSTATGLTTHNIVPDDWLEWDRRLPELITNCNRYSGISLSACWEELAHVALEVNNNKLSGVYRFCEHAKSQEGVRLCKSHSTGIMLISMEQNKSLAMKKAFCDEQLLTRPDDLPECYSIIIETYLYDHPGGLKESVDYCNSVASEFRKECFTTVGGMVLRKTNTSDVRECDKAGSLESICRGSGLTATYFPWEK